MVIQVFSPLKNEKKDELSFSVREILLTFLTHIFALRHLCISATSRDVNYSFISRVHGIELFSEISNKAAQEINIKEKRNDDFIFTEKIDHLIIKMLEND